MSAQGCLDFSARAAELVRREAEAAAEQALSERFAAFHAANPRVYETLVQLAREARAVGHRTVGIGMLWEVMRWRVSMSTTDATGWKLNNSFRSRYARLVMDLNPDLAGVFDLRQLKTE